MRHANLTPWILGIAVLLQTLDATSIAVALPAIAADLDRDMLAVSATISAYLLGAAAAVPPCGWLADRFGGRNVFQAGILLFVVASAACAVSTSLPALLAARFIEGAAGALLLPVGRLVIMRTFPAEERVQAYTTFVLPALLGPMLGPLIGGLVVEYASWRWIFLINLPLGLASMLAIHLLLDNFRESSPRRIDPLGMLITSLALLVLVFGLIALSRAEWAIGALAVGLGLLLGALAIGHARRHEHALLKLPLFRVALFRRALCTDLCLRLLMNAAPFLLSLLLQSGLGISPSVTGVLIVMIAIGSLLTKPFTYRWVDLYGSRCVMTLGTVGTVFSFVGCAFLSPSSSHLWIGALMLSFGFFRSLVASTTAVMIFQGVAPEDTGAATTLAAIGQQSFQVLGLTGVTVLMQFTSGDHPDTASISQAIVVSGLITLSSLYFIFKIGPVKTRP
ncbi:MFS transporter [Pseudomonas sp. BN414]|uniref:MFS transporter n=1 Tax=Pseudomonas sp. BN414 TaxID=2567888 RepID=UPI0024578D76|nr:MFS transporter [Pseudomonas sp. BN414]MDH4565211.1 MFS transporter [Pseudomonas sp. BN414]